MRLVVFTSLLSAVTAACGGVGAGTDEVTAVDSLPVFTRQGADDLLWVDPKGLRAHLASDRARVIVLDVRGSEAYAEKHIEGARPISFGQLEEALTELPRDQWLVMYCTCPDDAMAIQAATIARREGLDKAVVLEGGLEAWERAGYPTGSGQPTDLTAPGTH